MKVFSTHVDFRQRELIFPRTVKMKIDINSNTHKSKSPTQFLLIAYLKTSGLPGSKRTFANWALPLYPVSEDKI